jgi:hypothetical protein
VLIINVRKHDHLHRWWHGEEVSSRWWHREVSSKITRAFRFLTPGATHGHVSGEVNWFGNSMHREEVVDEIDIDSIITNFASRNFWRKF